MTASALRGEVVSLRGDPFLETPEDCLEHIPDALVVIEDGVIASVGPWDARAARGLDVAHYPGGIITPGFIDAHVHYPQTQMIGAFGEGLLEWLDKYTFVAEQDFANRVHAEEVAAVFLRELLRAGTTTAAVYCTVHPQSVEAFFAESERFDTRMIAGKVLMDRNAPEALLDTPESAYADSKRLIEAWHGRGRQLYCITPRFAPACSEEELAVAGRLWREHPGTYVQTHLCETTAEIDWVLDLFPGRESYLDVYDQAGLVGPRAIFGHAVHMDERDFCRCHEAGAALAHCPTSNLFLGSGLFKMFEARRADRPVHVALGTDLGAGTAFSQLRSLDEAYKVAKLGGGKLTAAHGLWLATRGGAEALHLGDRLGQVAPGMEADLVVLDPAATPILEFRSRFARDLMERLFVLMILGDDRAVRASWVAGRPVYDRDRPEAFRYAAEAPRAD